MIIFSRAESLVRKREYNAVAMGFMRWTDWKKTDITPVFRNGRVEAGQACYSSWEDNGANPPGSHNYQLKEKKVMGIHPATILLNKSKLCLAELVAFYGENSVVRRELLESSDRSQWLSDMEWQRHHKIQ